MRMVASLLPVIGMAMALLMAASTQAAAQNRTLSLYNTHTHERLTVTYKRNGRFVQAGLDQLNRFLRDWRRDEVTRIDPDLFDIVWTVYQEVNATEPIHVVSAYRSPATNDMLRRRSSGVARNSQHTQGRAMDFFIPGVQASTIREAGARLQRGGVGYYPRSGTPFVHLDTGSVRMWPRMTRRQLQALFPNGRTVHLPSDGEPLSGFALAQQDIQRRAGSAPSPSVTASRAQSDGDGDLVPPGESGGGFLQALFGGGSSDDGDAQPASPAAASAADDQPAATELASAPRPQYGAPAPTLPPYATLNGESFAPSTVAGLSVPSPAAAPTIDDVQLAALGRPAPPPPGAIALASAFSVAETTPQIEAFEALPPITREQQIAQTVPAPGQIAALIEARYAERRAAQASLTGQVDQAIEIAANTDIPGIEVYLEPQESLLTPGRLSAVPGVEGIEAVAVGQPRFVPPAPIPATPGAASPVAVAALPPDGSESPVLAAAASEPTIAAAPPDPSSQNALLAAAFAATQQAASPAQEAIDIVTGSTPAPPSAFGVTGQFYPMASDAGTVFTKTSIRGAQHAALISPASHVTLSPVLMRSGRFEPSTVFNGRQDGFDATGL